MEIFFGLRKKKVFNLFWNFSFRSLKNISYFIFVLKHNNTKSHSRKKYITILYKDLTSRQQCDISQAYSISDMSRLSARRIDGQLIKIEILKAVFV